MRRAILIVFLLFASCSDAPERAPEPGLGRALIDTKEGSQLLDVEFADTPELRRKGLAGRQRLGPGRGMVFLYFEDTDAGFWMRNTSIPLSIAFFDVDGTILEILDMDPCREDPCPTYQPSRPYRGALEVDQGSFERWGVEPGDKITLTR